MVERVRTGGAHVRMHSCGDVSAILPDLVEIGSNVLDAVEPQAPGIHFLAKVFGGIFCFNEGVDAQGLLILAGTTGVKRAVGELVNLFGSFSGSIIGGTVIRSCRGYR